ncbi:MAG: mevalonate kinase [Caldilineales bacterium]
MTTGSAPGKVILCGEHAVVYGRPAIAVPVSQVAATATVRPGAAGSGCVLDLSDIGETVPVSGASTGQPLVLVTKLALEALELPTPDWHIVLHSTIPVSSGLGSGAAAATAIVRAIAAAAGRSLTAGEISALVFESETLFHGTPSGIDNTVIAYGQPVWFVRGQPPEPFFVARPFTLTIGDTGIASPTSITVGDVRRGWKADPQRYETLFDAVGAIATVARIAVQSGDMGTLGRMMDENQTLLQEMDVSSVELDRLCAVARDAGALGAKLSGGGRGGNMIALTEPAAADRVAAALRQAGAVRTITSTVDAGK